MSCRQCRGIEGMFDEKYVTNELSRYRKKGPGDTTRLLIEALKKEGVQGLTLLDIGGGVGAIQHGLLEAGAVQAIDVDASSAYLSAARVEAQRRGYTDRIRFQQGDFVDLAANITPADIVTLDRVICCYPDMEKMVGLSVARTWKIYGMVIPRESWWVKIGLGVGNFFFRLRRNPFRTYVHPIRAVEAILSSNGFKRHSYRKTFIWQVAVYTR